MTAHRASHPHDVSRAGARQRERQGSYPRTFVRRRRRGDAEAHRGAVARELVERRRRERPDAARPVAQPHVHQKSVALAFSARSQGPRRRVERSTIKNEVAADARRARRRIFNRTIDNSAGERVRPLVQDHRRRASLRKVRHRRELREDVHAVQRVRLLVFVPVEAHLPRRFTCGRRVLDLGPPLDARLGVGGVRRHPGVLSKNLQGDGFERAARGLARAEPEGVLRHERARDEL